jgi:hypothetical protein
MISHIVRAGVGVQVVCESDMMTFGHFVDFVLTVAVEGGLPDGCSRLGRVPVVLDLMSAVLYSQPATCVRMRQADNQRAELGVVAGVST